MKTLRKGTRVSILRTPHADVANGTEGVIDGTVGDGYGVEVTANFTCPTGAKKETRVIYCEENDLKKL